MNRAQTEPVQPPVAPGRVPQSLELRHLRYFVAVADAGSFSHAAEQLFLAQPTLSQQIRRLEETIGTPLLHRRREGLRLTTAGCCWTRPGTFCGGANSRQRASPGPLRLVVSFCAPGPIRRPCAGRASGP
jgi:hypothetical protein